MKNKDWVVIFKNKGNSSPFAPTLPEACVVHGEGLTRVFNYEYIARTDGPINDINEVIDPIKHGSCEKNILWQGPSSNVLSLDFNGVWSDLAQKTYEGLGNVIEGSLKKGDYKTALKAAETTKKIRNTL